MGRKPNWLQSRLEYRYEALNAQKSIATQGESLIKKEKYAQKNLAK